MFVWRVPQQVRRSRFLLHLYETGRALQPKGGERVFLSSRLSIDPCGPASNRGGSPAGKISVVRYRTLSIIPVITDEDGFPAEEQLFPSTTKILQKLVPLWAYSIHEWTQILGRGPDGRPYFLDNRELQWANPTLSTPPQWPSSRPSLI